MTKPILSSYSTLTPLIIQKYERYLPTAFDDSMSMLQKMNKIIEQLEAMGELSNGLVTQWNSAMEWVLNEGLETSVDTKLDEMYADGTLTEVVNGVFDSLTKKLENTVGIDVSDYGALGDGTNQTTAIQNAVNAIVAIGGGVLRFPKGTYLFENIVIPKQIFLNIEGTTGRGTIFKPVGELSQFFTIGDGSLNTDYFRMKNIRIESTFNHDYSRPLFNLKFMRNVVIENITCQLSGTGTLFNLDTSYLIHVRNCMLRCGRYAVAFDHTNLAKAEEQQDTFKFENVIIFGNLGVVVRRTGGNYHSFTFDGLKCLNLSADGDMGRSNETTVTVNGVVGQTYIDVANAGSFLVNDPIVIGHGEYVELNKITAIVGTRISLQKPLSYPHTANAERIITSGVGVSLANPFNTLFIGCHWEGMPVAVMSDGAKGIDFISNYNGAGELLRICGGTQDVRIGNNVMNGQIIGARRNVGVVVPSSNTSVDIARIHIDGNLIVPSGSPALIVTEGLPSTINYSKQELSQGIQERTYNVPNGMASTKYIEKFNEGGAERFKRTYDGEFNWRDQATMDYLTANTVGLRTGNWKVNGLWNDGLLILGSMRLWVDSTNKLRYKMSDPISDTDGTVIGTQA